MSESKSESKGGVKPLPPLIALALVLAATVLHFAWTGWPRFALPWVGWPLFVLSFVPVLWVDRMFKKAGTVIKPHETPTALVVGGPFRFSRNPIYLSAIMGLTGLALGVGSAPFYGVPLLMALILRLGFIPMEERNMEAALGQPYLDYKTRVRRWI